MSIDEAIAMMHEWADYECRNEEQMQASEAFNQIAVLLEELKVLKSEPIDCGSDLGNAYYYNLGRENGYSKAENDYYAQSEKDRQSSYDCGYEVGYVKGIDDAKSVVLQTLDNEILVDTLYLRLEQLKAGEQND